MSQLKRSELARRLADLLSGKHDRHKVIRQIAAYLIETHQIGELDALLRSMTSIRQKNGIVEAKVTTAFPLSAAQEQRVKKLLTQEYPKATQIIIDNHIEPAVLSGVAIQTIDRQLDQTARTKLMQLTKGEASA